MTMEGEDVKGKVVRGGAVRGGGCVGRAEAERRHVNDLGIST